MASRARAAHYFVRWGKNTGLPVNSGNLSLVRQLKLTLLSRHHDPRTGDIEYRLVNISRAEPPPDLFMVPPDYTIVGAGERGGGARGARGAPAR
jgi:hypothetical protein